MVEVSCEIVLIGYVTFKYAVLQGHLNSGQC